MKEATGELNMTVVTIIAIGAVIAFFWLMWPTIKDSIAGTWNSVNTGGNGTRCPEGQSYNAATNACEADN